MTVVYDAGALVAAERSDRRLWAQHRARLEFGMVPLTTAPVVAQVSRSAQQVQLRRFLRGCEVVSLAATEAHDVGALAGASGVADVVHVHAVLVASRTGASLLTSDDHDLSGVAGTRPEPVALIRV